MFLWWGGKESIFGCSRDQRTILFVNLPLIVHICAGYPSCLFVKNRIFCENMMCGSLGENPWQHIPTS